MAGRLVILFWDNPVSGLVLGGREVNGNCRRIEKNHLFRKTAYLVRMAGDPPQIGGHDPDAAGGAVEKAAVLRL